MTSPAKTRMGKAKAALVIEQPFWATLVCSMPLVEDPNLFCRTLATDGKTIWYHPDWVMAHTDVECMWALSHEVGHGMFQHMARRGGRDPRRWNMAGDYCINQLLELDMAKGRPKGVLFDPALYKQGGGTAEGVYELLKSDAGAGGGYGDGDNPFDDLRDAPGDAAQQAEDEAMWKIKVSQAASVAKMAGQLNKELERFVGDLMNPKVPWEDVLKRFCMRQVRSDRSFARPARRHLHQGVYMPGESGVGMGDILIAVDQSGSVSQDELTRFCTEMTAIKEDARPHHMHVLYFAHTVMKHDVFTEDEPVIIAPNGTGGTAFSPIFAYALEHGIDPDCCVVLTDLYASDFGQHPDYPVLWCTTGSLDAPWGEVISIRD